MIPPVYHSLRRESIKNASSASAIGVQSVRPTWFEDIAARKDTTPPGWGIPGFGIELCCFLHPLNWPLVLLSLFLVSCFLFGANYHGTEAVIMHEL